MNAAVTRGGNEPGVIDITTDVKSKFKLMKNKNDRNNKEMQKKNNIFCAKILSIKERNNLKNI